MDSQKQVTSLQEQLQAITQQNKSLEEQQETYKEWCKRLQNSEQTLKQQLDCSNAQLATARDKYQSETEKLRRELAAMQDALKSKGQQCESVSLARQQESQKQVAT